MEQNCLIKKESLANSQWCLLRIAHIFLLFKMNILKAAETYEKCVLLLKKVIVVVVINVIDDDNVVLVVIVVCV